MNRFILLLAALAAAACAFAASANATELITNQGATRVGLQVNAKGEALLTYRVHGALKRVLAWGAINARQPVRGGRQVHFKLDYSGGWKTHHVKYWEQFGNRCGRYDGPPLPNLVAACKAPDGSYWAAQSWQRLLPNLGYVPWLPVQKANWLELSHWSGPVAQLEVGMNWIYDGMWQHVFSRLTYRGHPVYGFGTTRFGVPTDDFGRIIYIDTFNSKYGSGWRRENASVTHNPTGLFCYGLFPHDPTKGGYRHPRGETAPRGPGLGDKYRLTASGPGVTPNVAKVIEGLHRYDAGNAEDVALQRNAIARLAAWGAESDRGDCRAGWFDPARS